MTTLMYDKNNYGINHLRSLREIQFFYWVSSIIAWQRDDQGATGANQPESFYLVHRREIFKTIFETRTEAREKNKECLIYKRTTHIMPFVRSEVNYGKR